MSGLHHVRRRLGDESGQSLIMIMLALLALLAMAAFTIDVGYGYFGKRQLQAAVDAAALAGAQDLPNQTTAQATALNYSASSGGQNSRTEVLKNVNTTVTFKCRSDDPNCTQDNLIVVSATATVPTVFSKIFGINQFNVKASASACGPCGGHPADVMMVLDRTGSMCQDDSGRNDPSCSHLNDALNGIETLLKAFDPSQQHVGLAVFPPSGAGQTCSFSFFGRCWSYTGAVDDPCSVSSDTNYGYDNQNSNYVAVPLSSDFQNADGTLNTSSDLVSTVECQQASGGTSYAVALEKAQAELVADGRSDADKYIIFFSDGAANAGNGYYSSSSPYRTQPCHQGITSAGTAKLAGTTIISVAYDADGASGGASSCQNSTNSRNESPSITGVQALQGIATNTTKDYYVTASAGNVNSIFNQIAAQIVHGSLLTADST